MPENCPLVGEVVKEEGGRACSAVFDLPAAWVENGD